MEIALGCSAFSEVAECDIRRGRELKSVCCANSMRDLRSQCGRYRVLQCMSKGMFGVGVESYAHGVGARSYNEPAYFGLSRNHICWRRVGS
jgi:hypothetical protein